MKKRKTFKIIRNEGRDEKECRENFRYRRQVQNIQHTNNRSTERKLKQGDKINA